MTNSRPQPQKLPTVFIKTLGCKVNTYDTDAIRTEMTEKGFQMVDSAHEAEITILNSCSVTTSADRESRYLIRKFKRANPQGIIVATGCYAQTDSAALVAMDDVDLVVPNSHKQELVHILTQRWEQQEGLGLIPDHKNKLPEGVKSIDSNRQGHFKSSLELKPADPSRTRSFLKIQDGCNGFCTYCIIPYARGASRSVTPQEVRQEIRRQIQLGTQEIVLTGIHIGDFARDIDGSGDEPLATLIQECFDWPDMVRLRISSLEPMEMSEPLLKALSKRPELFCDHFHLPLQSGNDRILKLMRRTYQVSGYRAKLEMARQYFPRAFFSADIIPGFPSETEEEAQSTEAFIESIGLHELHVFPYSPRPNTAALRMPDKVNQDVIKNRASRLRQLSERLKQGFLTKRIGSKTNVLWENNTTPSGQQLGRGQNYIEVVAPKSHTFEVGTVSPMLLKGFYATGQLLGVPAHQ